MSPHYIPSLRAAHDRLRDLLRPIAFLSVLVLAVSCSSVKTDAERDPLEPFNRAVYRFNYVLDGLVIRPVTQIYRGVLPEFARDRVSNALSNLRSPVSFFNALLQGDPDLAFTVFWRFVLNTTFGVAGTFDFAGYYGIHARDEDFGQTLGHWGVGSGPYLVLPIIGPSSFRDAIGKGVDVVSDPFVWWFTTEENLARGVATVIDTRSTYWDTINDVYKNSLDPYATFRSAYLQKREDEVKNTSSSKRTNGVKKKQ